MDALAKLLAISSAPLTTAPPELSAAAEMRGVADDSLEGLLRLLAVKNGFLAFESALLVLPSVSTEEVPGILDWNSPGGWRRHYDTIGDGVLFFAMDLFAAQFGVTDAGVVRLEPEAGEITRHSDTLESWADTLLSDYSFETGWSVGREWQRRNGPLPLRQRLLGKRPFVLGGDYVVENLSAVGIREALEKLGRLYRQIKDVPDGTPIKIRDWGV